MGVWGPLNLGVILTTHQIQGWPISDPILDGLNIGLMPNLLINGVFYPLQMAPKCPLFGMSLNTVFRFCGKNRMSKHQSKVHHIQARLENTPFWQNGKLPVRGCSPGGPLIPHIHPYLRPIRDGSRNPFNGDLLKYRDLSRSHPVTDALVMC